MAVHIFHIYIYINLVMGGGKVTSPNPLFRKFFLSSNSSGSCRLLIVCRKQMHCATIFFPKAPAKGFSLSTAAYFIFLNLFLLLHLPHSLFLTLFLLLHLPHSLFLTLFILLHLPYFIFFTNFLLLHPRNIII